MVKTDELLGEIVHLASAAIVADKDEVNRQALADIADAIAAILPVEGKKVGAEGRAETGRACRPATAEGEERKALEKIALRLRALNTTNMYPEQVKWLDETRQIAEDALGRACRPATAEEPQGMAKFLRISDRLQLVRFRGKDFVQLVGRVKGIHGGHNQVFEIHVDKTDRTATVYRDEKVLWTIQGNVNSALVEQLAVSTLHRWYKSMRNANKRSHRKVGAEGRAETKKEVK